MWKKKNTYRESSLAVSFYIVLQISKNISAYLSNCDRKDVITDILQKQ